MMPPICAICRERFGDLERGGLVTFAKRPEDHAWDRKMKESGAKGHPPYARWFCPEHFAAARELAASTVEVAMPRLRGEAS